jgi:ATP-dependent Lhr-like helicase
VREEALGKVQPGGTTIAREPGGDVRWWTWAGFRANATLAATVGEVVDPAQRVEDAFIRLRSDLTAEAWKAAIAGAAGKLCLPGVDERALHGLKFSAALPPRLAEATLAARLADLEGATTVLHEAARFSST